MRTGKDLDEREPLTSANSKAPTAPIGRNLTQVRAEEARLKLSSFREGPSGGEQLLQIR